MGRTGIYDSGEDINRRNSLESVALFSLKQEAPASIGGSTFTWGGFLAGALIGSSTHSVYYDDEVAPLTYDGVKRGYLDRVGNIVIDSKNDAVYPMTEFGTFVRNKGKLGFVNRKGQYLIAPGNYSLDDGLLDDVDGFVSLKNKENGKWGVFSMVDGIEVV